MGFVTKPNEKGSVTTIAFEAFKFPTSDVVQFRAIVNPCLQACEPVFCSANNYDGRSIEQKSFGRRRRSIDSNLLTSDEQSLSNRGRNNNEEELVLVQSIKIVDSFEHGKNKKNKQLESAEQYSEEFIDHVSSEQIGVGCVNVAGLTMICSMFLLVQLLLIVFWSICWMRRNQEHKSSAKILLNGPESGLSLYSVFTGSNSSLRSTGKTNSRCLPNLTNAQSSNCSPAFAKNHC